MKDPVKYDVIGTDQQIVQHKSYTTSVITVVNYEKYQADGTADVDS